MEAEPMRMLRNLLQKGATRIGIILDDDDVPVNRMSDAINTACKVTISRVPAGRVPGI